MRKFTIILILTVVSSMFAVSEPFQFSDEPALFRELIPDTLITYPPVRMWTLDNGMPVLFWENHTAPVVSMRVGVFTGSMYEDKYLGAGISHYLEHIVSGGTTERLTETEYNELLDGIGAYKNAYTTRELTCYYIEGPAAHFGTELNCLADWVTACAFDKKELEREKGVITQEIYKGMEEPSRVMSDLYYQTLFRVHPAKFPIIGYIENFLAITPEELQDYYNIYYSPDNCVLAIAGDLTPAEVIAFADSFFGDWERKPKKAKTVPPEPPQVTARYAEREAVVQTSTMKVGWRGSASGTSDGYALDILTDILTDGKSSRLHKRLITQEQLCGDIYCYHYNPSSYPPVFTITVDKFDYEDRDKILDIIWEEVGKIKDEGIEKDELEKQKKLLVKSLMFENETVSGQTSNLMYNYMRYGRPLSIDFLVPRYLAVTREDIERVAVEYIIPQTMTVALLRPPIEKETGELAAKPESGIEFGKKVLDNGLTVIAAENHNVPHFDIQIFFNGGLRCEPLDMTGLSKLTSEYLMEGIEGYSTPEKLSEYIESNGYRVGTGSGNNTISVDGKLLKMDIEPGLELLAKITFEPTFPEKSLPKLKQRLYRELEGQQGDWHSEAYYYYREVYFDEHPYAGNPAGEEEDIEKITLKDIRDFYNRYVIPGNCALAISGPKSKDELFALVEKYFGEYESDNGVQTPLPTPNVRTISETHLKETGREQVTLVIGYPAPSLLDDDRYALLVMNNIISGLQGSLHEELRGKRDLVYLVWSSTFIGPAGGTHYIMTQTSPDNYDTVYAVILRELDRIKSGDFSDKEIATSKTAIRESFYRGMQEQENHVVSAALDELYGLGYDYDDRYLGYIDEVTKEEIVAYANKYLKNPVTVAIAPEGFTVK